MERFMRIALCSIGVVLLSIVSSLGVFYYMGDNQSPCQEDMSVNVLVDNAVGQVLNPVFNSTEEVLQYVILQKQSAVADSILLTIPEPALVNIASVVIGRYGKATKESIVEEFRQHYPDTYKFIKPVPQESTTTPPHERQVPPDTIKLKPDATFDTIINGKHFTLIKETE